MPGRAAIGGIATALMVGVFASVSEAATLTLTHVLTGTGLFGRDVDVDGDDVLVGAQLAEQAYLYDAGIGTRIATFVGPDAFGYFGGTVRLDGDRALIGANQADGGAGRAFLFNTANGTLLQQFDNPSPGTNDFFSLAGMDLRGDRALIGALRDGPGEAYLYDTTTGELLRRFAQPDPDEGDEFGAGAALDGRRALISASQDDVGAAGAGAAYLFDTETGELLRSFENPTPAAGDRFGDTVALSGDFALVGAPYADDAGTDTGSAHLFDAQTGALLRTFTNPNPTLGDPNGTQGDRFGQRFAVSGNLALISAFHEDGNRGAAYLFDLSTGDLLQTLYGSGSGNFGYSVALSADHAVIAEPFTDRVNVYSVTQTPAPVPAPATLPLALTSASVLWILRRRVRRPA